MKLILTFYRSFIAASSLITMACLSAISINGLKILPAVLLFKLVTLGIIILYINLYKKKEFYYYQNLGFPKLMLWIFTLGIDLVVFILLIAVII